MPTIAFEALFGDFEKLLYSLFVGSLLSPLFSLEQDCLPKSRLVSPPSDLLWPSAFSVRKDSSRKKHIGASPGFPDSELHEQ